MKSCETCLYSATHEKCDGCLGNQPFAYKNWTEGDGIARRRELENSGQRNIVIGGEAEVNVNWKPDEAYKELFRVAEACGYSINRRNWGFSSCQIEIGTPDGHFVVTWWDGKLYAIERVTTHILWHS